MDARRWSDPSARPTIGLDVPHIGAASMSLAILGILLILFAIPFGLMLAPLAIGVVALVFALRRMDRALALADRSPAA
jgi:hypothetical protein